MIDPAEKGLCLIAARGVYDSDACLVRPDDGVLIQDGIIRAIGDLRQLSRDFPQARQIDLRPCLLFPGLINTHVHLEFDTSLDPRSGFLAQSPGVRLLLAAEHARTMLRSGVTTIRDAGSTWGLLELRDPALAGALPLPRLLLAGPPVTVTGGHLYYMGEEADSDDELIKAVRLRAKRGCDAVKLVISGGQLTPGSGPERTSYDARQIGLITRQARHLGLPTFAHCLTAEAFVNGMRGGVDCIEHVSFYVRDPDTRLLARQFTPAMVREFQGDDRFFMNGLSCMYHCLDQARSGEKAPDAREAFMLEQERRMFSNFRALMDLGMRPVLGTDAGTPVTYFEESWLELALMVEGCGLSPARAIQAGTVDAACCLGLEQVTGRLAAGFSADIIALEQDPLENIRALRDIRYVLCAGKLIR